MAARMLHPRLVDFGDFGEHALANDLARTDPLRDEAQLHRRLIGFGARAEELVLDPKERPHRKSPHSPPRGDAIFRLRRGCRKAIRGGAPYWPPAGLEKLG